MCSIGRRACEVGTRAWGQVAVPEWALRYLQVRDLIAKHSDDDWLEDAVCYFLSPELVRDDIFPEEIHRDLQALRVPYDFKYCTSDELGTRAGGWRPGMREPVEFWIDPDGERLFTLLEICGALENLTLSADQIRALDGLLEEHQRALARLEHATDPRLARSDMLRTDSQRTAQRRRKLRL